MHPSPPRIAFEADLEALRAQFEAASHAERLQAMRTLEATARASGHPVDWDRLASACHILGREEDAVAILEQLVAAAERYRFKLAVTLFNAGHVELCRYHLQLLAGHAGADGIGGSAREQLALIERQLHGDESERNLQRLQREALEERVNVGAATSEDYQRLAALLIDSKRVDHDEWSIIRAIEVLQQGITRMPDDLEMLEMLARLRTRFDPEGQLESLLDALRRRLPESDVFDMLERDEARADEDWFPRYRYLTGTIKSGGPAVVAAAAQDLRRLAARYPGNPFIRGSVASALLLLGETDRALKEAHLASRLQCDDYHFHRGLARLFVRVNEPDRVQHHAKRALELTSSADERREIEELVATTKV